MKKRTPATRPANKPVVTIPKGLNQQHKTVITDLFENHVSESDVCIRHGLALDELRRWYRDDAFRQEVSLRLFAPVAKARALLARNAASAVTKLICLSESDKDEVARKACLDILRLLPWVHDEVRELPADQIGTDPSRLAAEAASRILAVFAEGRQPDEHLRVQADSLSKTPETPVRKLAQLNPPTLPDPEDSSPVPTDGAPEPFIG
jgi:hypothetical protein